MTSNLIRFVRSITEMDDFSKQDRQMSADECYRLLMIIQKEAKRVIRRAILSEIQIKSNDEQTIKELSEALFPLIEDRRSLLSKKSELDNQLNSIKDEISMIEAEMQLHLRKNKVQEFKGLGIHAETRIELAPKIVDFKKAFDWVDKNNKWDIIRADFLKKRDVINILDKEGKSIDGVELNSYTKFKVK